MQRYITCSRFPVCKLLYLLACGLFGRVKLHWSFIPFFTSSSLNSTESSYRTTPFMEHQVHWRSIFFIIIIIWSLFLLCFSWICICKPNFKHFLHLCLDVDVQYNVAFLYRPWSSSSLELDEAKSIRKHCF